MNSSKSQMDGSIPYTPETEKDHPQFLVPFDKASLEIEGLEGNEKI